MIIGLTEKFKRTKLYRTKFIEEIEKEISGGLPDIMYIWGQHGNGKSITVQLIGRAMSKKGYRVKYTTMSDYLIELYKREWMERMKYHIKIRGEYDLIIIDEIDKVKMTEWKEELIFNLLDWRVANCKKTIVVGNKNINQLTSQLGLSIVSRLADAVIIENKGDVQR